MINASISQREAPHGFTEHWDGSIWNVGFIFQWSIVHQQWVNQNLPTTVKPGQCLADAFRARIDPSGLDSTWLAGWTAGHFNIYFTKDN